MTIRTAEGTSPSPARVVLMSPSENIFLGKLVMKVIGWAEPPSFRFKSTKRRTAASSSFTPKEFVNVSPFGRRIWGGGREEEEEDERKEDEEYGKEGEE